MDDIEFSELICLLSKIVNVKNENINVIGHYYYNKMLSYKIHVNERNEKEIKDNIQWAFPNGILHPLIQNSFDLKNKITIDYISNNRKHKFLSFYTIGMFLLYVLYFSLVIIVIYLSTLYIISFYYLGKRFLLPFIKYIYDS